jgi:hypothetical protein
MSERLPSEHGLTLRQIDGVRGDVYELLDELHLLRELVVRLPTRRQVAALVLLGTLTGCALTAALLLMLLH